MVAVVGAPAEGELGEVARADHDAADLVRLVHEQIRAAAGLRVLIRDVLHGLVSPEVLQVLTRHRRDVDRLERHTESLAKQLRIALRPLRRPEARHRVGVDALPVEPEPVERLHADKQRKRTVESARQAEDNILAPDRLQPRR